VTSTRSPWPLVAGSVAPAFALSAWFTLRAGIPNAGDTPRYLQAGELLMRGEKPTSPPGYRGYEAIVGLITTAHLGSAGVVAFQFAAAAVAVFAVYQLGRRLHGPNAGLLAALIASANLDVARWHAFVLSNSLYASAVSIAAWTVHEATSGRRAFILWAVLSSVVAIGARPEGGALALVLISYVTARVLARSPPRGRGVIVGGAIVVIVALFATLGPSLARGTSAAVNGSNVVSGVVVWGERGQSLRVGMPPADTLPRWDLGDYVAYAARHPLDYARLVGTRIAAEFGHVRPYYSLRTNIVMPAILLVLYIAAVVGYRRAHDRALARLLAAIVAVHGAIIGLTFAESDGRLLVHSMGPITVLAGAGLASIAHGFRSRANARRLR
jgi:hypothetical protein